MSIHNIGFYEEISKIITYQISSNMHLISSAAKGIRISEKLPLCSKAGSGD